MYEAVRRIRRPHDERWIAGVCAGLGEYARIDPTVVRLALVAVTLFTALVPGILAYLAAWVIVPAEPAALPAAAEATGENGG